MAINLTNARSATAKPVSGNPRILLRAMGIVLAGMFTPANVWSAEPVRLTNGLLEVRLNSEQGRFDLIDAHVSLRRFTTRGRWAGAAKIPERPERKCGPSLDLRRRVALPAGDLQPGH